MGTLDTDGDLAEGIYHTLINVQNNTPENIDINIKVSVPANDSKKPVVTRDATIRLDPYESVQVDGKDIRKLLEKTPFSKSPFISGNVLIFSKSKSIDVSAAYTFYQANII